MTQWLAGMKITATRLNDASLDDSTATGLVAATGFSVNSFAGRRSRGNVVLDIYLNRTGATITATSGNITDTLCCTVPAGWRVPHQTISGFWDTGVTGGGAVMGTDGLTTLRTAYGDLASGGNIRLQFVFNQN
jgi:hypothetical protein